jgi:hypothetical protein
MLRINLTTPTSLVVSIETLETIFLTHRIDAFVITNPGSRLVELVRGVPTKIVMETYPDTENSPSISLTSESIIFSSYEHLGSVRYVVPRTAATNQEVVDWLTAYVNLGKSG